jgi:hypothetical protein
MFQLSSPEYENTKAAWLAQCRQRLLGACEQEKVTLSAQEIEQCIDAAWHLENGAGPDFRTLAVRAIRHLDNRFIDDAKSIADAAGNLMATIEKSLDAVRIDLVEELKGRGVALDQFEKGLAALAEVASEMSKQRRNIQKPGNTTEHRNEWALHLWPTLAVKGTSMKAGGRVLAALLDPQTGAADSIYQAIRNARIR